MNIEKAYWEIFKNVDPDLDLAPSNIESEKSLFFKEIDKGKKYCPQFEYRLPEFHREVDNLLELESSVTQLPAELQSSYNTLLLQLAEWINRVSVRDQEFDSWLYGLYGRPDESTLKLAICTLDGLSAPKPTSGGYIDPATLLKKSLEQLGFNGWKIKKMEMAAKMRVSSATKTLFISPDAKFSKAAIERLVVHEIETHILRHENGLLQNDLIYAFGFPGYLETEEGLAIYSEWKCNLLDDADLRKYCLRVLASELAFSMSFYDVYKEISEYTNIEEAFSITLRVKRGLEDTNRPLGYSKDSVYFSGLQKMKLQTSEDIKKLYIGKIGLAELEYLNFEKLEPPRNKPDWLTLSG